jgi:hypothetical protein
MITLLNSTKPLSKSQLNPMQSGNAGGLVAVADFQNTQGVYKFGTGVVDIFPIPRSTTYSVTSAAGAGAADVTFSVFNEDVFNETPTDNGSGAGSVVSSYDDGFEGRSINQLIRTANGGRGLLCKGFSVIYTTGGAQDPSGLLNSSLQMLFFNSKNGASVPFQLDIAEALRNTQQQSGTITVWADFFVNSLSQFTGVVPAGDNAKIVFLWQGGNY